MFYCLYCYWMYLCTVELLYYIFMEIKVFDKVISINSKKRCVEELLGRFESQDRTGGDVTVVFTNDRCMKPIVDEFRECLKCLLADYEREIAEL